ncbi:hypothetical protein SAMN04487895_10812 [Paenibacillus sophorae]|uniref:Uncharacterized protein n=1 Tax=Paenibacillus sophorae TaxID=1333845 RepID=A0A1H8PZR3_9BACL|nr:hypothetical protein [Paenibacillus sophorae]QWU15324.1 hypothetical protein KP014_26150 [Paenibacillus sophorae]SEO47482.1 hypothetical protein SAMN04487895_10812 [Paenibacillus sophorae]
MNGVRRLYITKSNKVFKIPQSNKVSKRFIEDLARQEVLEVLLYYEIKERKPSKLLMVEFDRITLDTNGEYQITEEEKSRGLHNFLHFGLVTPEELANREGPPILPLAPVLPLRNEKEALYKYLKEKINVLFKDTPFIVEMRIESLEQKHREYIDLVKKSTKLK